METEKDKNAEPKPGKMEDIFRERVRLDKIIQEQYRKKTTILFSDVCGFTQYMDKKGDISGCAWIQKHHDIVLPAIEKNGGKVLAIMGDGIMASFSTDLSAVKAAVAIQKDLHAYNEKTDPDEEIHVKIGINSGNILVDGDSIMGDAVNVASRIQGQAGPDKILVAKCVYDEVRGSEDILCRVHDKVPVKGKFEPLELYRVIWQEEDIVLSAEGRVRSREIDTEKRIKTPIKMLQIEITQEEDRLRISADEQISGEAMTLRHYEEIPVSKEKIGAQCREIVEMLNRVNRKGLLTRDVLFKLRETGQIIRDELFTLSVKEKIKKTDAKHLMLILDDQLIHIPWELLHDGQQFLCQQFSMGRLVKTRQTILGSRTRALGRPFKMLILADPEGNLKGACEEGIQIRNFMDRFKDFVSVSMRSDGITTDFIRGKIRNFDLVHFAGHAEYDPKNPGESGWLLSDGILKAKEIANLAGTGSMPALIFANACQSARSEEWSISEHSQHEICGLANAFMLSGVKHYVGTFWEVLDEPSRRFAVEFYKQALSGKTVGEAVREARLTLIREYGEETIVWASYLLYGDPTFNYMDQVMGVDPLPLPEPQSPPMLEGAVRSRERMLDFVKKEAKKKGKAGWAIAAGIILILGILLWGYPGFLKEGTKKYETVAITYYNDGKFEDALNSTKTLEDKNPKLRLTYLIQGNVRLRKGDMDAAEAAYQKALKATDGTSKQKAEALIGLGRIASLRKQTDVALKYYQQATEAAPESHSGYLSQALVLEGSGKYDNAIALLDKAQKLTPNDPVIAAIASETRKKVDLVNDQKKQERIDRLVKELIESMKTRPAAVPSDGWKSPPLTLWLMDFKTQGYSLQEGEERLLTAGITDRLIAGSRVQVVERALLDKLLEELKLGTSKLIDRKTELSLGKILAARLILSGQIIYSGSQTQISMRLIETETGRIGAALSESFGSVVPASIMTEKMSVSLLSKLNSLYPLRGKITEIKGNEIKIDIGQTHGVVVGQKFRAMDGSGILEIIATQPEDSSAKVVTKEKDFFKGERMEAF
jgi:class 3 adenylate cyclase/CHAT domain-containing protein/tetratricopeptide (TPR) repeat protein